MPDITKATDAEREVLETVLRELRHTMATGHTMQIHLDPWTDRKGIYIHVYHDPSGNSFTFSGEFRKRRKR